MPSLSKGLSKKREISTVRKNIKIGKIADVGMQNFKNDHGKYALARSANYVHI